MATSFYDVVVIGSDLGATVAGAVLSQQGFRVLVAGVPRKERYEIGPYVLPRSPLCLTYPDSAIFKRIFGDLNLLQLVRRRIEPNRPAYQVILPNHRIDVDAQFLADELAREMPDVTVQPLLERSSNLCSALESLLAEDPPLPPEGFWERREITRLSAKLPLGEIDLDSPLPPEHLFRLLRRLPALFALDDASPSTLAIARAFDLHLRGTYRIDGGRESLRSLLFDRIEAHSGEIRAELEPKSIEIKRGKVAGVSFSGRGQSVGCSNVICGLPARTVMNMLEGDRPPKRLVESAAREPSHYRYRLQVVAPLEAIPPPLARLSFSVRDPSAPLERANALAIHFADGYGQHAVVSVEALQPAGELRPESLAALRQSMRQHLLEIFPFIEQHIVLEHSPHDGQPPTSIEQWEAPPSVPMDAVWRFDAPNSEARAFGVSGVHSTTGIKKLYLASRQVLPALGLEGELKAGWNAAKRVLSTEKKRDLVKGEVLLGG